MHSALNRSSNDDGMEKKRKRTSTNSLEHIRLEDTVVIAAEVQALSSVSPSKEQDKRDGISILSKSEINERFKAIKMGGGEALLGNFRAQFHLQ